MGLTRYSDIGASSRVRFYLYEKKLSSVFNLDLKCLLEDDYINDLYSCGRRRRKRLIRCYFKRLCQLFKLSKYDVVWVQKELFPFIPAWFELFFLRNKKLILDYDDATFHTYDQNPNFIVKLLLGRKIDKLMSYAEVVVVGNSYLGNRAKLAGAKRVEFLPSVIDISKYQKKIHSAKCQSRPFIIGWIGSPGSQKLLESLLPTLSFLAATENIILKTIGATKLSYPNLIIEQVDWSSETEVNDIKSFDVGIMPVQDEPFQNGKCGFKLIQYMACAIPVIASPVGFNCDIVKNGGNGFLAKNDTDWIKHIKYFIKKPTELHRMGLIGRETVESKFTLDVTIDQLTEIIKSV